MASATWPGLAPWRLCPPGSSTGLISKPAIAHPGEDCEGGFHDRLAARGVEQTPWRARCVGLLFRLLHVGPVERDRGVGVRMGQRVVKRSSS